MDFFNKKVMKFVIELGDMILYIFFMKNIEVGVKKKKKFA